MTPLEDLALLRAFVRIAESRSISVAARTLKVPQPTLSRHLRLLEERCGMPLLRRDTHRMSLTEAGHRLLEDASAILELAEAATLRLREDQAVLKGHLRLFATVDFGQFTVTRLISHFLKEHPAVTAELSYSNRPLRMIEGGFDAGVVVGEITDDSVVARSAGSVVRYLVAAPSLVEKQKIAKEPSDLESWPWVSLSAAQFGGSEEVILFAPKRAKQALRIAPLLISEGVTSMREAVRAGTGVAILPDWLAREDLVSGRLVRLLPQWNAKEFPVSVIFQGGRNVPARVRAFVDFAASYMTTEMHSNP